MSGLPAATPLPASPGPSPKRMTDRGIQAMHIDV